MGTISADHMAGGYATAKAAEKPKPRKDELRPLFLYFADVSEADLAKVAAAETKSEVRKLLQELMKIDQPEGLKAEILVDMHYHNYSFCVSSGFPPEKTSTFLSIMKVVLEDAVRLRLTPEDAFNQFQDWLLKHSVERPPRSVGIFSFDDVKSIVEYATNTFFRHIRLYMYAFMTHCDVRLRVEEPGRGAAPLVVQPLPMSVDDEVDPRLQPELAHLFRPSDQEAAEAEMRRIREKAQEPEDQRAAIIKQRVEEGVKRLMETFEGKLKEQDERFQAALSG
eukprot:gb/GFBE01042851.1/.p1 GENE.gb/GFBE01042851.1/~~gb/GFBE01042851.1/.p1  ORF type:complete len:280 (+),score=69.58 gb/GFBE01042851.1/:1-840(+)